MLAARAFWFGGVEASVSSFPFRDGSVAVDLVGGTARVAA